MDDLFYMKEAYQVAVKAFENNETPVGCVIVHDGIIIGRGANNRITQKSVLYHAEIIAIGQACAVMNDWRLEQCRLYVTIEPCPMCAGAIIQARIPVVVYGASNPKAGCAGSVLNILNEPRFKHQAQIITGIMQEECAGLMTRFFKRFRSN